MTVTKGHRVELVHRNKLRTRDEAKRKIFEYVEMCYNNSGCIQRLDNLSPFEYEKLVIPS